MVQDSRVFLQLNIDAQCNSKWEDILWKGTKVTRILLDEKIWNLMEKRKIQKKI